MKHAGKQKAVGSFPSPSRWDMSTVTSGPVNIGQCRTMSGGLGAETPKDI